jgi:hypothetical protein
MKIWEQLELVNSKESLADFVSALSADLRTNREEWGNTKLEHYLEATEALIRSRNGEYSPEGKVATSPLSWREIAETLFYAHTYD